LQHTQFLIIPFIRLLLEQAGLTALLSEQWSARQLIAELLGMYNERVSGAWYELIV
jgi:hypothetical protein